VAVITGNGSVFSGPTEAQSKYDKELGLLTVRELAECLRVHENTIYRLLRKHGLPAFRVGGGWRFNRETIERWMRQQQDPI
jgi:excisionase family DNA binding protein